MKKLCLSSLLSIVLLTTGLYHAAARQKKSTPPNIIFILVDDMGYGDVGVFYQHIRKQRNDRSEPWMLTPNLDKLAASGVMLTEHYCAAPVCAPSRASLLSGLSQGHANVRDNQFDKALADNYTLGNIMQKAGYTTAAIGKWGLQGEVDGEEPNWPAYPLKRGFDYFLGYVRHRDGHEHYPKEGLYRDKKQVWENDKNIAPVLDKCYTGDLWTAAAKRWIVKQHQKNKNIPFFLFLSFDTPHATLELPTQEYPAGGGLKGGMQWLDEPGHMITTASGTPDSWIHPDYINATWDHDKNAATPEVAWPNTYKRYATIVRRIDDQVGDLMQLLSDMDIDKNTMVVFASDNGPSQESYLPKEYVSNEADFFNSFGPFDGIKRDVWEGGIRVPAIVSWPSHIKSSAKIKSPSAFYDWLPTFANAAGLPAPAFSDGHTLMPLLTGQTTTDNNRTVYIEYAVGGNTPDYTDFAEAHRNRIRNQMQMLRMGDTVAVRYDIQSADDDFEIYNVVKDPQQTNNLALKNNMAAKQTALKQTVTAMRRPDTSAARPYDNALMPPIANTEEIKAGIQWEYYKGNFPWLPAAGSVTASETGVSESLELTQLKADHEGAVYYKGFLNVPVNGSYTFHARIQGPFVMRIHDALVFDNDFGYEKKKVTQAHILLKAGLHPFRIYYGRKDGSLQTVPEITWEITGSAAKSDFKEIVYIKKR